MTTVPIDVETFSVCALPAAANVVGPEKVSKSMRSPKASPGEAPRTSRHAARGANPRGRRVISRIPLEGLGGPGVGPHTGRRGGLRGPAYDGNPSREMDPSNHG